MSTPEPRISAYVPAFNAARYLREVVEALRAQSLRPAEIIVVDDASTDVTPQLLPELPVRIIRHDRNRGLAAARNSALSAAAGDFLAGVDSDVVADPGWLETLFCALRQSGAAAAGGRLLERHAESLADRWRARIMRQHHGDAPARNVEIYGSNGLFEIPALRAIGGWNERYRRAYDDVDITKRLIGSGRATVYVPNALCRHVKRDTIRSVLDSAYEWRRPPFEEQGAFEHPAKLASRWLVTVRFDIEELEALSRGDDRELAYVTYTGLFRSILRDLLAVHAAAPPLLDTADVRAGAAMLLHALAAVRNTPRELADAVAGELGDLLGRDPITGIAAAALAAGGEPCTVLLSRLSIAPSPAFRCLAAALEPIAAAVPMSDAVRAALTAGAGEVSEG